MLGKEEVLKQIRAHKKELSQFGVKRLALFGSFARGDQQEASDLDFLVDLEPKTYDAYIGLKYFLEDLFCRKVDLVLSGCIKARIFHHVQRELVDAA